MPENTSIEKNSMEKQAALIADALEKAKDSQGYWLNKSGRLQPAFYGKQVVVSPFNALLMGLHSDKTDSKTAQYVLFSESKDSGHPVKTKQVGLPFNWARFENYVNRFKPDDVIGREQYLHLEDSDKELYKAIPSKETRVVFNLSQTILPDTRKNDYAKVVQEFGGRSDRPEMENAENKLRVKVNDYILSLRDNLCRIQKSDSDLSYYDPHKDTVILAAQNLYPTYEEYVQDVMRTTISATGHPERLGRAAMIQPADTIVNEDAEKMEKLVEEVASAVKMQELGLPAKLSKEGLQLVDYWVRELRENPRMIHTLEGDVNFSIAMVNKANRGEKVELGTERIQKEAEKRHRPLHYFIADKMKQLPSKEDKIMVVVLNSTQKKADVILPAGASEGTANEIPGMSKSRIEKALRKQGVEDVRFYNVDGALGYRHDDAFYRDKTISTQRLNNWDLEKLSSLDISDAVKNADTTILENIQLSKENDGKWVMYIKPENQEGYGMYADSKDLQLFFAAAKHGDKDVIAQIKNNIAEKYNGIAMSHPELKLTLAGDVAKDIDTSKVLKSNLYKDKEGNVRCYVTLEGMEDKKFLPRPVTQQQWQRLFIAEDKTAFKKNLAAVLFPDLLRGENIEASLDNRQSTKKTVSPQAPIIVTPKMVDNWLKNAPGTDVAPEKFDNIVMMKDDNGKWAALVKPEGDKTRCVYPDREDLAIFFDTMKNGDSNVEEVRNALARKAYVMFDKEPDRRADLFSSRATDSQLALIEKANIFKTTPSEKYPESKLLCTVTIDGVQQKPREVSNEQWQRMWLAPDMQQFKKKLAGTLFLDILQEKEALIQDMDAHTEDKECTRLLSEIDSLKKESKTETDVHKVFDIKEKIKILEAQLKDRLAMLSGESDKYGKTLDIPVWASKMILEGNDEGLTAEQKKAVNDFLDNNFADGFFPEVVEGKEKDNNLQPAFGDQPVKTVAIRFDPPAYFEKRDEGNEEGIKVEKLSEKYDTKEFAKDKESMKLYNEMMALDKKCRAETQPRHKRDLFEEMKKVQKALDTRLETLKNQPKLEKSPILKQFLDLKAKHPEALLLFRCGDFYETYKDDAEKASKILGITLTKSSKTKDDEGKPLAMAGFPYHALDTYLPKLIRAGQRVAICDQIEQSRPRPSAVQQEKQEQKQEQKVGQEDNRSHGFHR